MKNKLKKLLSILLVGLMAVPICGFGKKNVMINDMNKKQIKKIVKKDRINKENCINDLLKVTITKDGKKDIVVVKFNTDYNVTNKMTIQGFYQDIEAVAKSVNPKKTKEIQYWCTGDLKNGDNVKVFSCTINNDTIKDIQNENILTTELKDMTEASEDLYIYPALKEGVKDLVFNE